MEQTNRIGQNRKSKQEISENQIGDGILLCPVCGIAQTSIIGVSGDPEDTAEESVSGRPILHSVAIHLECADGHVWQHVYRAANGGILLAEHSVVTEKTVHPVDAATAEPQNRGILDRALRWSLRGLDRGSVDHVTLAELPGTALGWIRQKAGWSLQRMVARLNESSGIATELSHVLGPTTVERIERSAYARPVLTRLYRELIGAEVFDGLVQHGRSKRPAVFAVHGTVTM